MSSDESIKEVLTSPGFKGRVGEFKVNARLEQSLPQDQYRLIKDVTLPVHNGGTTQIDHIVVSRYGVFVIETKNWEGRIFGAPADKHWTQKITRQHSEKVGNPIRQSYRHRMALAKYLTIDPDAQLFSVVVLAGRGTFPIKKPENVVYLDDCAPYIRSKTEALFTEKQAAEFIEIIECARLSPGPETDRLHNENVAGKDITASPAPAAENTLDSKLAAAQSRRAKKRRNVVVYGGATVLGALLSFLLLSLIIQPGPAKTPLQEAGESIPQSDNAAAGESGQVFREQFMHQLAQYESEVEPKIDEIRLQQWAPEKYAELTRLKERAIELFAGGDYVLAREKLQQANARAAEGLADYATRLANAKRAANEAFQNGQIPEAELANQRALHLNPADAEMLALQKRLAVLPQVLALTRQAEIAKIENRPEKEIAALQKLLAIDPSPELQSRLRALQAQTSRQQFSGAIRKAQRALDAGRLADASAQLARAKKIFPAHEALAPLQNQLQRAAAQKEFEQHLALGEQARRRDDWPAAAQHFQRARQLKPADQTAVENDDLAARVNDTTRRLSRALAEEHRLGDKNIVAAVSAYLQQAEPLAGVSPRLREVHGELARKVALYQTEVEVIVVSDNATHIIVRGEGQIGKTARRIIRLRPGTHVFEGSRPGYRSKLVTANIRPGAASVEVTIVCDEKL